MHGAVARHLHNLLSESPVRPGTHCASSALTPLVQAREAGAPDGLPGPTPAPAHSRGAGLGNGLFPQFSAPGSPHPLSLPPPPLHARRQRALPARGRPSAGLHWSGLTPRAIAGAHPSFPAVLPRPAGVFRSGRPVCRVSSGSSPSSPRPVPRFSPSSLAGCGSVCSWLSRPQRCVHRNRGAELGGGPDFPRGQLFPGRHSSPDDYEHINLHITGAKCLLH